MKRKTSDTRPASQRAGLLAYKHPDRFGEMLGYESLKVDRASGKGLARLKIREDHLSPANRVHGGVISACFDVALGLAVFSTMGPWDVCSTVELKVSYLKPIHLGDDLIFKSEVDFRGRRLCVVHSYAYKNGEKQPTAMASGTYYVISTHATAEPKPKSAKARRKR